jgi:hypothetical protein
MEERKTVIATICCNKLRALTWLPYTFYLTTTYTVCCNTMTMTSIISSIYYGLDYYVNWTVFNCHTQCCSDRVSFRLSHESRRVAQSRVKSRVISLSDRVEARTPLVSSQINGSTQVASSQ